MKIEVFKKTADRPRSSATHLKINVGYSKNTLRTIVIIICIVFFTVLFWSFNIGNTSEDASSESNPFISRLILVFIAQFTLFNLIPIIFIVRNVKLYKFVKKQVKTWFNFQLPVQNLRRRLRPFDVYVVPQSTIVKSPSTSTNFEML